MVKSNWPERERSYRTQMINALGRALDVEGVVFYCALTAGLRIEQLCDELRFNPQAIRQAIESLAQLELR